MCHEAIETVDSVRSSEQLPFECCGFTVAAICAVAVTAFAAACWTVASRIECQRTAAVSIAASIADYTADSVATRAARTATARLAAVS